MTRFALPFVCAAALLAGCGHDTPKGAAEQDTVFGDTPEAGQVPGQGRIDRGGGATAEGFPAPSETNFTQEGTGLQNPPEEKK
jgi:hypothetical protein